MKTAKHTATVYYSAVNRAWADRCGYLEWASHAVDQASPSFHYSTINNISVYTVV